MSVHFDQNPQRKHRRVREIAYFQENALNITKFTSHFFAYKCSETSYAQYSHSIRKITSKYNLFFARRSTILRIEFYTQLTG